MDIDPSFPVQTEGLEEEKLPALGVGGNALITTLTVAAGDVQLPVDCVTVIVYEPAGRGISQFVFVFELPIPAARELADQLKVAP